MLSPAVEEVGELLAVEVAVVGVPLVAVGDVSLPPLGAAVCAMTVEGESSVIRTVALVMGVTK